jgi:hypothetical protein
MTLLLMAMMPAHAELRTVEICVKYQLDYEDAAFGDFWTDNSNRVAHGLKVQFQDDLSTWDDWLDDHTGCITTDVEVSGPGKPFLFRVFSKARVSGVDIESHNSNLGARRA